MIEEFVRIGAFRKGKFTQKEMADMLNLSERQYRRIEKKHLQARHMVGNPNSRCAGCKRPSRIVGLQSRNRPIGTCYPVLAYFNNVKHI